MKRPENARYSQTHEWAILKGDVLTLGVTDWAIEHLGDLVYVDLPDPGTDPSRRATRPARSSP